MDELVHQVSEQKIPKKLSLQHQAYLRRPWTGSFAWTTLAPCTEPKACKMKSHHMYKERHLKKKCKLPLRRKGNTWCPRQTPKMGISSHSWSRRRHIPERLNNYILFLFFLKKEVKAQNKKSNWPRLWC